MNNIKFLVLITSIAALDGLLFGYDTGVINGAQFYLTKYFELDAATQGWVKDCNVIGEILLSRYDLFLKRKIRTHTTTNLNAQELESRYGIRVRSRMREFFNLIAFDKESLDKRK